MVQLLTELSASSSESDSVGYELYPVDADKLGHAAYAVGSDCYNRVVEHFGPLVAERNTDGGVVHSLTNSSDGTINRAELGSIVFGDSSQMKALEALVWPFIRQQIEKVIASKTVTTAVGLKDGMNSVMVNPRKVILIEAAIMIEAKFHDMLDVLIVSHAEPNIATERLMKRNNLTREQALKRIHAQMSNEEKLRYAHVAISNNCEPSIFDSNVKKLWNEILDHFNQSHSSSLDDYLSEELVRTKASKLKQPIT